MAAPRERVQDMAIEQFVAMHRKKMKAQGSLQWETEMMEVKPSSFQHIVLRQKHLLLLLSYLWHYNRYFAFTHDNRTLHRTVEKMFDVKNQ